MGDGKSMNWMKTMKEKHAMAVLLLVIVTGSFAAGCVSGWMIATTYSTVPRAEELILVPIRVAFNGWANPPTEVYLITVEYDVMVSRALLVKITDEIWATQSKYVFSVSVTRDSAGRIVSTNVHEQYLPKEYVLEVYAPSHYLVDYLYLHTIDKVWAGTWPMYADISVVNEFGN